MSLQSSSSFRRSGVRDDRRRRLLADELANPGDWPSADSHSDDPSPYRMDHYGNAEFLDQQLRLLDLIPRGWVSILLGTLTGIAVLAGLEAAYLWMLDRAAERHTITTALDLAEKGSLGCWFSSLLLLGSSIVALLIYSVRRYRLDDYQGRYRIWLWAASCWFFMAADQAASLREGFRDLMIALTDTPLSADGNVWWVILYGLLFGAVGSRLVIEMRSNRTSVAVFIGSVLFFAVTVLIRLDWLLPSLEGRKVAIYSGVEMACHLMLILSMILYARHVLLDAEGLLSQRDFDMEEAEAEEAAERAKTGSYQQPWQPWRQADAPHATPQPIFQRKPTLTSAGVSNSPPASPVIQAPINRKLTKQEKKVLKERLLRERMERERRGL